MPSTPGNSADPDATRPYREELSERVENFRRRRARLRQGSDSTLGLDFDFPANEKSEAAFESGFDDVSSPEREIEFPWTTQAGTTAQTPVLDSIPLESSDPAWALPQAGPMDVPLEKEEKKPAEILLELPTPTSKPAASSLGLPIAPLGRRFLAGILDALVLLAGAGLFALVFWRAGGHLSLQPFNLAVLAFIAGFFTAAYFAVFTALTSSTPGLVSLGLEVRNLEGDYPSTGESFWRGFGYLVSVAGLMLGFLWVLVDSDGLTWHDRISGTYLTLAPQGSGK